MSGIYLSSHSVASLSLQYLGNSSKMQTFQRNPFLKHLTYTLYLKTSLAKILLWI